MPPRNPQHTYRFVSAALRDRIEAGEWVPGEQLPTVRDIAEQYGVSLNTARKAMQVIADAGLVEVFPGYGVFRKA